MSGSEQSRRQAMGTTREIKPYTRMACEGPVLSDGGASLALDSRAAAVP